MSTRPSPCASRTTPASPNTTAWVSSRFRAAACASIPPTPMMRTSFSGSQFILRASMRAKTQVVEPTTVTPIVPPLRSSSRLILDVTVRVKWFFSTMVQRACCPAPRRPPPLPLSPSSENFAALPCTRLRPDVAPSQGRSSPLPQTPIQMLQEQHHRDRQGRHDGRRGEELGGFEGHGLALHEIPHSAVSRKHLREEHAQDGEDHGDAQAGEHGGEQ